MALVSPKRSSGRAVCDVVADRCRRRCATHELPRCCSGRLRGLETIGRLRFSDPDTQSQFEGRNELRAGGKNGSESERSDGQ